MEVIFDDVLDEFLFKHSLEHCCYNDPENPEFSKLMNMYLDKLRQKYLITVKPFDNKKFEEIYNEVTKKYPQIMELLNGT